jgi:hypothetical protein
MKLPKLEAVDYYIIIAFVIIIPIIGYVYSLYHEQRVADCVHWKHNLDTFTNLTKKKVELGFYHLRCS